MKDYYVNLNSLPVRLAVSFVIVNITKVEIPVKDIKFGRTKTKHGLWIRNKFVFCYDKHLHCPRKKQHAYAIYEFLKAVEHTCQNYAPIKAKKQKLKCPSCNESCLVEQSYGLKCAFCGWTKYKSKRKVVGLSYQRVLAVLKKSPVPRKTSLFPKKTRSK
ncbi:MAG: hypothetical protein PHF86_10860 [Candidatus Nanoarchaeia archaeon]|jgi:transposase-like protein|nr:hypothetical protein [Candidatus Nanoarchaeia archaeon]